MAFTHVLGDEVSIYAAAVDGSLLWYRDELHDGTNGPHAERGWAANSGNHIGEGWTNFRHVISGGNGLIYAVTDSGDLLWYRDDLRDGSNGPHAERGWAANSGNHIGEGWTNFRHVISGGNGLIYAVTDSGDLLWYRDDLRDGSNGPHAERGWAANSGNHIGEGWTNFRHVISGGNGLIYAVTDSGDLLWYRDDLRDGSNGPHAERGWAANSGNHIGQGWTNFAALTAPGDGSGIIYAITDAADLLWYRDDLRDGTNGPHAERGWAANSGNHIGQGWSIK
ncbi:tachylectin-related carbohydrate-binding protein [Kribbella sp. CA-245084]|uniref:tachylectin-related carbohydrate-binding protein n=1 Tax=Kribbella sp. CA-245084 TaxID=3239940 RepID=UPI003D8AAA35